MLFAVAVRAAQLRNCVVNFPVVQMVRNIATTSLPNSHETDSFHPIQSQKEFSKAYPEYVFNHKKQLVAPSDVGPKAMEELFANLSQQLLRCYRTCDKSKVPYMNQLFVHLVPLAGMKLWPWQKKLYDKDGGDSAILNAMLHHRHDAGVQQFGCWALSNLAVAGEAVARTMKKKGAIEVCRIAIETHPKNAEVLRQARNAMGAFSPLPPSGNNNA